MAGAGNAVIGALRAVLGIDTAQFETGLKSANSSLAGFGAGVAGVAAAAAAAFAAVGAAVGVALSRTIDDMDKLNKTSQKIGIPVEQLSSLAYAADLADVSFEQLSKGVGKLNKSLVEAAGKPTSDAANAFRALGVSVTDANGKLKTSDVVMGDLADAFKGLSDEGPGKAAAAMAIFGKAGAELIPLLNSGKKGLAEMRAEAAQFGAVVSTEGAQRAEQFNDNMTRLGYAIKGVFVQVAERLLPILVDVSNKMVEAAKNSSGLELVISALSFSMKGLVTAGILVSATMKALGDTLSIIWGGLARLIKGDVSGAFEHLKSKAGDIATTAASMKESLAGIWAPGEMDGAVSAFIASQEKATASQKQLNYALMAGKNAVDSFIDSQKKGLAGQQAEIATFGMLAGAREAAKLQLQAEAIAAANRTAISPAQQAALDLEKQKASDYAMTLAGLQMTQANLTPAQLFQQEQIKIQALFDAGKISAETYGEAMQKAAERAGITWAQASASLGGSFENIGQSLSQMNKDWARFAKIGQAIGAGIAFVNSYVAATNALASATFPANIAIAAGVLAKGLAMVASIKSVGGFATGGSLTVPGGIGGGDSVKAMVDLQPGEQLDIWRPGEGPGDPRRGAGGGAGGRIEISGIKPGDLLTFDMAVAMVEKLSEAAGFGYVIKSPSVA